MHTDPSKQHLRKMLDAGISKMMNQYNEHCFSKTSIFSIGTSCLHTNKTYINTDAGPVSPPPLTSFQVDRKPLAIEACGIRETHY
jgi:hypothetical protein